MRIIPCPIPGYDSQTDDGKPVYYVGLPDVWLGKHEARRSEAWAKTIEGGVTLLVFVKFAASMAILSDWHLPNLPQNPDEWQLDEYPVSVMAWVNEVAFDDLMACFDVKKNYYSPSANGTSQRTTILSS